MSEITKELELIRQKSGTVQPADVVEFARTNPSSALYRRFNWDVKEAAYENWLLTARNIIRVHVKILDDGSGNKQPMRAFVNIEAPKGVPQSGYRRTEEVLDDPEDRKALVCATLTRMWNIYKSYPLPELEPVRRAIEECRRTQCTVRLEAAE